MEEISTPDSHENYRKIIMTQARYDKLSKGLTRDNAKFIFEQAEKYLVESIESDKLQTDRAYSALAVLVPIFLALIGYISTTFDFEKMKGKFWINLLTENFQIILAVIASAFLFNSIRKIFSISFPKKLFLMGTDPDLLMKIDLEKYKEKDEQEMYMLLWQANDYQGRIEHNEKQNEKRAEIFQSALKGIKYMILTILSAIGLYLLIHLLSNLPLYR